MAEKITGIVKNLLGGMRSISRTETLVGEPMQLGGATVIPIHRLRVGFLAGAVDAGGRATSSEGKTGGQAVGGTAQLDPVAVLAIGPDGRPRLLSVEGEAEGTWQGLLRDAPDLMAKVLRKLGERIDATAAQKPALDSSQATSASSGQDLAHKDG
jgi:uncharacterized spore protein YtfJ